MIDLYGQCVQISIYDEDYQGIQLVEVPTERTVVETIPTTEETIEGTSPGMLVTNENISFKMLSKTLLQHSIEWLQHSISFTDSEVRTTLYSAMNSNTGKYCSVAFSCMVTFRDFVCKLKRSDQFVK